MLVLLLSSWSDNDLIQIFVDLFGQLQIMELDIVDECKRDVLHFVNVFGIQILEDSVFENEW